MTSPNVLQYAAVAKKGDLTSDYLAGGDEGRGLLPPSVAREFIMAMNDGDDYVRDMNPQTMLDPIHYLDVAGFMGRVSFKDVAGVAMTSDQKSSLTITREPLTGKWFRAGSSINYHVRNENIMRDGIGAFVQKDLTRQAGYDFGESCILGDTESEVDGLDNFDGAIKKAEDYTLGSLASPAEIADQIFYDLLQSMPNRGKRNKADMRFCCSQNVESAYAKWLRENTNIATGSFYEGQDPGNRIKYDGIRVVPYNAWPDTHIQLVSKWNACPGIFIEMFLELKHDADAGVDLYILRFAGDFAFAEPALVRQWAGLDLGVVASLG